MSRSKAEASKQRSAARISENISTIETIQVAIIHGASYYWTV